jgi:glycosyltransferase involved in cell wall biosynthesis
MRSPKLTVLTTVHNRERYIERTIESVLAQDFTDFEYVIVDDGSTDRTSEILQRFAGQDARIVVERIPRNTGVAHALNRGLAIARGNYICKQDSDDICINPRLRAQVELLDREPDVALVSANLTLIDAHGMWVGDLNNDTPSALFRYLLMFSNAEPGAGCQGMFRREIARDLGGFCEDLEASVDYEFLTRLIGKGRFVVLPIAGSLKRCHADQISVRSRDAQRRNSYSISRRMLTAYLERDLSNEEFLATMSVWYREGGTKVAASADLVLREAYTRFAMAQPDRNLCKRVQRITAEHWVLSAITLMRHGTLREASDHLLRAVRWHPAGTIIALASSARRFLLGGYRAIRPVFPRWRPIA